MNRHCSHGSKSTSPASSNQISLNIQVESTASSLAHDDNCHVPNKLIALVVTPSTQISIIDDDPDHPWLKRDRHVAGLQRPSAPQAFAPPPHYKANRNGPSPI